MLIVAFVFSKNSIPTMSSCGEFSSIDLIYPIFLRNSLLIQVMSLFPLGSEFAAVRSRVGCFIILLVFLIKRLLTMLSSASVSIIDGMKYPFSITLIVKTLLHVGPQVERVTGLCFATP